MTERLASATHVKTFYHLLVNTLVTSVMNFTLWFALTFFVYLETRSVFALSIIAGFNLVATATTGIWFGSLVDHYKKKVVMIASTIASLILYIAGFVIYQMAGSEAFKDTGSFTLWIFVLVLTAGVIAGNIRMIALPTIVTILIPKDKRDRANGLVGSTTGVSFLVTSVISGLLVAAGGMFYALLLVMAILVFSLLHLIKIQLPEKNIVHTEDAPKKIDLKGTLKIVRGVPGLSALILFSTFNNFLGGVTTALIDAYGLSLVTVQVWGILWGVLSSGLIIGGIVIAKTGLGKNPLRTLLIVNLIMWTASILFPMQASIILLSVGIWIYMYLIPYAEAAEQTILQRVVPYERQGRVFGFAQSVEQAASPLTAFLIGPITQFIFIPWMTTGWGAETIGSWFGTGPDRGMAIAFILAAVIGLIVTLLAFGSKAYRELSRRYLIDDSRKATS